MTGVLYGFFCFLRDKRVTHPHRPSLYGLPAILSTPHPEFPYPALSPAHPVTPGVGEETSWPPESVSLGGRCASRLQALPGPGCSPGSGTNQARKFRGFIPRGLKSPPVTGGRPGGISRCPPRDGKGHAREKATNLPTPFLTHPQPTVSGVTLRMTDESRVKGSLKNTAPLEPRPGPARVRSHRISSRSPRTFKGGEPAGRPTMLPWPAVSHFPFQRRQGPAFPSPCPVTPALRSVRRWLPREGKNPGRTPGTCSSGWIRRSRNGDSHPPP